MTTLFKDTDHRVEINNLRDQDGALVVGANINMTLYASDGVSEVSGVSWPITLTHQGSGNYVGVLPNESEVKVRMTYILEVIAQTGSTVRTWREPVYVRNSEF